MTGRPEPELRLRVALFERATAALKDYCTRNKVTQTQAMNKAIRLLNKLDTEVKAGAVILRRLPDGTTHELGLLKPPRKDNS